MKNEFIHLIGQRHCTRGFLDKAVERTLLIDVLTAAASAPSSQNTQPWKVAVLSGTTRDDLSRRLCENFCNDGAPTPDYLNRPKDLTESMAARSAAYGKEMLEFKGIGRDDKAARRQHRKENFDFFGAPVELIFHLPGNAAPGTFLDLGFFMQNVILGLEASGLASCPQYSVASFSKIIKSCLALDEDRIVVSGMAVGYPDQDNSINQFYPKRDALDQYVKFYE
ncbi:MAG: hypothetical protein GKR95_25260 [Gammaproteobacteria bacterium]|nr:hypothetical protein [Gammaproteobacteria bacterium]